MAYRITFHELESDTGFVAKGETFLAAAVALLEELTVFCEMDSAIYMGLASLRDGAKEFSSSKLSSPEENFKLTCAVIEEKKESGLKIQMTAYDLNDRGLWEKVCEMKGHDVYKLQMWGKDELITFNENEARLLGLI